MKRPFDGEEHVWKYLLNNPAAKDHELAKECGISLYDARSYISKIGTPLEVRVKSAVHEWEDETIQIEAEGRKDDADKPRYDLIPPEMPEAVARVLAFGARKYAPRNWEKGMKWGRPFAALMRHMWAWWRGEKLDPETGMSHLWHAACCITFLIAYEARNVGEDDRPKGN